MDFSLKSVLPKLMVTVFLSLFGGKFVSSGEKCLLAMETIGYTVPSGDIYVRYGNSLDIYCILNEEKALKIGPNASQRLRFQRNSVILAQDMVQVINSTTIKLHVDKPAKSHQDNFVCIFENATRFEAVCMNFVYVGVPPQEITDFRCISRNLEFLTCTWTAPENYVATKYNLSYAASLNTFTSFSCPNLQESETLSNVSKMSCTWDVGTNPIYRQSLSEYYFFLTASNFFGTYKMPPVHFKHFENVRPNAPENLKILGRTWNSVNLSWTVPTNMQTFPPGLNHRIMYQSAYGKKSWYLRLLNTTKDVEEFQYTLDNLEYAHAYYDIRVSSISAIADPNDLSLWSDNASLTVLTSSKKPDYPPKTDIGSFEILTYGNNSDRNVRIYWSHIPEEARNGQNFSYVVAIEGQEDDVKNTENAYMLIEGLSPHKTYTFFIWAKNEMGLSHEKSVVRVPTLEDCARPPTGLMKGVLGRGHYHLSWHPPEGREKIMNYTIFWCNDEKDPRPCTGKLDWIVVPATAISHNQSIPSNKTYQFAISANTERGSSGMTWAQCTDLYYKDSVPKITAFWRMNIGSNFIQVKWILGCPDKSVTGYIIYYCPIISPIERTCKEPEKNVTVPYNENTATIANVAPYTTYSMEIAAIINHTSYGQRNEKTLSTTLEAAPSTPPTHLKVRKITNSTIEISWRAPVETNGMLKFYRVFWNKDTKQVNPDPDSITQYTNLTGLVSYQTYTITVQACTVTCSAHSETLNVQTEIGYPGNIPRPFMAQNASYTVISWEKPSEPNGRIERYELRLKERLDNRNSTHIFNSTGHEWVIQSCGKDKKYNSFYVSVRAVNIDKGKIYYGNWSDEVESYCRSSSNYVIYILVPATVLFLLAMTYFFRKMYSHFQAMRDVGVKLPQGLQGEVLETDINLSNWSQKPRLDDGIHIAADDEEQLLMKKSEGSPILNVMDSSGCSSEHGSVSCPADSASNISTSSDSGTEQPVAESAEHLAATSTSLRQRNIRPSSLIKPPYVVLPLDSNNTAMTKTANKSYCVLGVDPSTGFESSSTYITLPFMNDKPTYNTSDN